jgi:hypothetical protein
MTTLTITPVPVKAPKAPKPATRLVNLHVPLGGSWGVLTISIDRAETLYYVRKIPSDFGDGFELHKFAIFGGEQYHVHLSDEGHTCDCPGGTYHGHCKHADALAALRDHGKL